jgi:hypothetical protein
MKVLSQLLGKLKMTTMLIDRPEVGFLAPNMLSRTYGVPESSRDLWMDELTI